MIANKRSKFLSTQIQIKVIEWKNCAVNIIRDNCKDQTFIIANTLLNEKFNVKIKEAQ